MEFLTISAIFRQIGESHEKLKWPELGSDISLKQIILFLFIRFVPNILGQNTNKIYYRCAQYVQFAFKGLNAKSEYEF